jgi:uncharacterized membrane protein YdbT with pleckstrin-like domain
MSAPRSTTDDIIWNKRSFPQQLNPNEDIIMVTREDIAIIVFKTIGFFCIFFVFFLIRMVLSGLVSDTFWISMYDSFLWGATIILLMTYSIVFHNYYLSMQIVTTERLIDIDQTGLFHREVNELDMKNIQDVTYKQTGFWQAILGFGNVIVETAGTNVGPQDNQVGSFVFNNVPSPKDVSAQINNLYHSNKDQILQETAQKNAEAIKQVLDRGNPDAPTPL